MRRALIVAVCAMAILIVGFAGLRLWRSSRPWPTPSSEVVQLTHEKRLVLGQLEAEEKFGPNDYPPIGYTGAATPKVRACASAAVDSVIDALLVRPNGPLKARTVSDLIAGAMQEVESLDIEDRERTQGYLLEIWYVLGFKGATGHFVYGSASNRPPGYGEPLPPGWTAPDKPRPIDAES